jgi:hypothetical protein
VNYFTQQILPNLLADALAVPLGAAAGWLVVRFHLGKLREHLVQQVSAELHRHYIVPPPHRSDQ